MSRSPLTALLACALVSGCALLGPPPTFPSVTTPVTAKVDQVDDYHGTSVADPYRWLEDDRSDETAAWVEEQNAVTRAVIDAIPARDELAERLTELWNYERQGIPTPLGDGYMWSQNDGLQAQNVLVYGRSPHAAERVLIDPNTWSADGTVALASTSESPDGRYLAYATSEAGSDWRTWRVRDVSTGSDLPDVVRWSKFSTATWSPDSRGFWYGHYEAPRAEDELKGANTNMRLSYHRLGTDSAQDRLVHADPSNPNRLYSVEVTDDERFVLLYSRLGSVNKWLVHVREVARPGAPFVAIDDSGENDLGYVGNDGDIFYFTTTTGAPRRRVVAVDRHAPAPSNWRDVVPQSTDTLQSATLFGDTLVLRRMRDARHVVSLVDLRSGAERPVPLPGLGRVGGLSGERDADETFFSFTSFTRPSTSYRLDPTTGAIEELWRPDLPFDPDRFETTQVFAPSLVDETPVPLFLVHRKGLRPNGKRPVYLYAYGGFNVSMTPGFSVERLPFLERGGVYAHAVLRGGGEYGEDWHKAGMLENKQNVFDDFHGCVEWLKTSGWSRSDRIAIAGGSNGGLLVGATMTQRPESIGCAIPAVGVMDMLRYHRFTIGWAWGSEYGRADDPDQFPYLYAYSPLHNLVPGTRYPATLVMTADHDDRVVPAHSFKFAAALQAAQAGPAPTLIRIATKAGHGAGKSVDMRIAESADKWAFVLRALGQE